MKPENKNPSPDPTKTSPDPRQGENPTEGGKNICDPQIETKENHELPRVPRVERPPNAPEKVIQEVETREPGQRDAADKL